MSSLGTKRSLSSSFCLLETGMNFTDFATYLRFPLPPVPIGVYAISRVLQIIVMFQGITLEDLICHLILVLLLSIILINLTSEVDFTGNVVL